MSHVATVDLQILDLDALKAACEEIGLIWKEGQKTYRWYQKWMNDYGKDDAAYKNGIKPEDYGKCEHAIGTKSNGYEIGVVKNPKGKGYVLIWDFFDGTIEKAAGKQCDKLFKTYSKNVAVKQVKRLGYTAQVTTNANGEIEITATKY